MQVKKARELGFCFGVKKTLKLFDDMGADSSGVHTLGTLVHNPQVVKSLQARGVGVAQDVASVPGGTLTITAHGASPTSIAEAQRRGLRLVDTTCPLVTKVQKIAQDLHNQGYQVVVFGDHKHQEVRGIVGWTDDTALVSADAEELVPRLIALSRSGKRVPKRLAVVSQTTQPAERFKKFIADLFSHLPDDFREVQVHNTICDPTLDRQSAVIDLAQEVDIMIVVGGHDSANTRHLAELSEEEGLETYHVEWPDELRPEWFEGHMVAGVTAGASTPDDVIEEVVRRIEMY
ncbi:MAG: 4-hydroxy-3-methylbut-2-enyl diphosphate reductase [Chloroflexota bacterium]|nr:4-hydroxy-3-methylbut-2-enyl diphosphate reductase [Chloroflexota bacterium]